MNTLYFMLLLLGCICLVIVLSMVRLQMAMRKKTIKGEQGESGFQEFGSGGESMYARIERRGYVLNRVMRLRSLHCTDKALYLPLGMLGRSSLRSENALMNLEQGSKLRLERIGYKGGHSLYAVESADGTRIGGIEIADGSPADEILKSGVVTGIYYAGFMGEVYPQPSIVIYYVKERKRTDNPMSGIHFNLHTIPFFQN